MSRKHAQMHAWLVEWKKQKKTKNKSFDYLRSNNCWNLKVALLFQCKLFFTRRQMFWHFQTQTFKWVVKATYRMYYIYVTRMPKLWKMLQLGSMKSFMFELFLPSIYNIKENVYDFVNELFVLFHASKLRPSGIVKLLIKINKPFL